jgi:hypothetical protein
VIYYRAPDGTVPALEFLDSCPGKIDAEFTAALDAVAAAPPPRFSGGGKWEAMHGTMGGWYEIRVTGPGREQFRLFACWRTPPPLSSPGAACKGAPSRSSPACASPGAPRSPKAITSASAASATITNTTIHAG